MKSELPSFIPRPEQQPMGHSESVDIIASNKGLESTAELDSKHLNQDASIEETMRDISFSLPQIQPSQVIVDDDKKTTTESPVVAADEDLIEKEWVDKAKKVVRETKDDPYLQEEAVGALRTDYIDKRIDKRYGESKRVA